MYSGHYELTCGCDEMDGEFRCDAYSSFVRPSRLEAKAAAREAGWMLGQRYSKARCPAHADERRASNYRKTGKN